MNSCFSIFTMFSFVVSLLSPSVEANPNEDLKVFSQNSVLTSRNWDTLEHQYPDLFRGLSVLKTAPVFGTNAFEAYFAPHDGVYPAIMRLRDDLKNTDPASIVRADLYKKTLKSLEDHLAQDRASLKIFHYYIFCACAIYSVSEVTQEHRDFSVAVNATDLMAMLANAPDLFLEYDTLDFLREFIKLADVSAARTSYRTPKEFRDPHKVMKQTLEENAFLGQHAFVPTLDPDGGALGFFALALSYAVGVHPVPLSLNADDCELHGISMPPLVQVLHDWAHSLADMNNDALRDFSVKLINFYNEQWIEKINEAVQSRKLYEKIEQDNAALGEGESKLELPVKLYITREQRQASTTSKLIAPLAAFAVKVHNASRQAIADVLLAALDNEIASEGAISDAFYHFSVGAFENLHENKGLSPQEWSRAYAQGSIDKIFMLEDPIKQNAIVADKKATVDDEGDDIFNTSYIDGSSPLTDQEIVDALVKQVKEASDPYNQITKLFMDVEYSGSAYLSNVHPRDLGDYIDGFSVERNKYNIIVTLSLSNGQMIRHQYSTMYLRSRNFSHDETVLRAAKVSDAERPIIPNVADYKDREAEYEAAVKDCYAKQQDLLDTVESDYRIKAIELAQGDIKSRYETTFSEALAELKTRLPQWLLDQYTAEDGTIDLIPFLKEACGVVEDVDAPVVSVGYIAGPVDL